MQSPFTPNIPGLLLVSAQQFAQQVGNSQCMEYSWSKIQQLVYTNVYTMSEGDIQISCVLYKRHKWALPSCKQSHQEKNKQNMG